MSKQIFINLLSERFKHFGLKTVTANDDADLLIAKTAIPQTWDIPVNVIVRLSCHSLDLALFWSKGSQNYGGNIGSNMED